MNVDSMQTLSRSGYSAVTGNQDRQQTSTEAAAFSGLADHFWELMEQVDPPNEAKAAYASRSNSTDTDSTNWLDRLFSVFLPELLGLTGSSDALLDEGGDGNSASATSAENTAGSAGGSNQAYQSDASGSTQQSDASGQTHQSDAPTKEFTGTGPVGSVGTGISQIEPKGVLASSTLMQTREEAYAAYVDGGDVDPGWWFVFSRNAEDELAGINWDPAKAPAQVVYRQGNKLVVESRYEQPPIDPYTGKFNYFSTDQPLPSSAYTTGSQAQQSANAYWGIDQLA